MTTVEAERSRLTVAGDARDPAFRELLDRFRDGLTTKIDQLELARQNGDRLQIQKLAHRLSGSSALYGHHRLSRVAAAVDTAIAYSDLPGLPECVSELIETAQEAIESAS